MTSFTGSFAGTNPLIPNLRCSKIFVNERKERMWREREERKKKKVKNESFPALGLGVLAFEMFPPPPPLLPPPLFTVPIFRDKFIPLADEGYLHFFSLVFYHFQKEKIFWGNKSNQYHFFFLWRTIFFLMSIFFCAKKGYLKRSEKLQRKISPTKKKPWIFFGSFFLVLLWIWFLIIFFILFFLLYNFLLFFYFTIRRL